VIFKDKIIYIKYFLFVLILAISTWEYFYRVSNQVLYIIFPFVLLIFIHLRRRLDTGLLTLLPFVSIFIVQIFLYKIPQYFPATFFLRLFTIYLIAKIINRNFIVISINTIYFIAVYSLFFYLLINIKYTNTLLYQLSDNFTNLGSRPETVKDWSNFIIYNLTIKPEGFLLYRNSGPFREPGLFAIFLNIAFFFNLLRTNKVLGKVNIVLIISILSTFSTNGIIVLLIIIIIYFQFNKSVNRYLRFFYLISLLFFVPLIYNLPFMGDKIEEQFSQKDLSYSRFGAIYTHFKILEDFPLTGLPYKEQVYFDYSDDVSPNGITEILIRYGYLVGFFYYFLLFRACKSIVGLLGYRKLSFVLFLVMILLLFSQTIGNNPIYWLFIFMQFSLNRSPKGV